MYILLNIKFFVLLKSSTSVYSVYRQLKRAKHWWGISRYQRAGGASRRAGGEIVPALCMLNNALVNSRLFETSKPRKEAFTRKMCGVISALHALSTKTRIYHGRSPSQGRFHRPGLTLQLANPRFRDNRGLFPACVPSLSVNLTAHLTCDLTSFR